MNERTPGMPRIADSRKDGCCSWGDFKEDFLEYWPRWFDTPPLAKHWQSAARDWKAGNTGYEAAHNAQRRAKERVVKLVHLGGRNYAEEGSRIAKTFVRAASSLDEGER